MAQFPFPGPKTPRSTFLNRAASPFVAISRVIAACNVASGVFPPGLVQRLRFCISAINSVHRIGWSLVASTRAAASSALMRFSRSGLVARVAGFAGDWGWVLVLPLVVCGVFLVPLSLAPLVFLGLAFAVFVFLVFWALGIVNIS
jgi:hypothetical protein